MRRLVLFLALLAAGCATPAERGLPDGIAVLGDSISRATNVDGAQFGDHPAHSWATGGAPDDGIQSHLERLRALDPRLDVVAFNNARAGATIADLLPQAQEAAKQRAQYVVVLLGANDVCDGTSGHDFQKALRAGAQALAATNAEVLLVSVPDVTQLVELYGGNETARTVWKAYGICPLVLDPGADLHVPRALTETYNALLASEADLRGWRWDGGAASRIAYAERDVSEVDYFHPSLAGQARLAEVTWEAGPYGGARAEG